MALRIGPPPLRAPPSLHRVKSGTLGSKDREFAADSKVVWEAMMGLGIILYFRKAMDDPVLPVCAAGAKVCGICPTGPSLLLLFSPFVISALLL